VLTLFFAAGTLNGFSEALNSKADAKECHADATPNNVAAATGPSNAAVFTHSMHLDEKSVNRKLEQARFPDTATFPITRFYVH
jgi:hypothetical protein